MNTIDAFLNRITMYRLVVYGLGVASIYGILLASIGRLSMSPIAMIVSALIIGASCYTVEYMYAKIWRVPYNHESWVITALIIFLIIPAPKDFNDSIAILLIGVIASVSKYLIAWKGKHIFNPAAFAVVVAGFLNVQITSWWVGNSATWLLMLVVGLLVVRKIKKFQLVIAFILVTLILQLAVFIFQGKMSATIVESFLIASPLIFLSTIMLTEPATMPNRWIHQLIFAAIVAILYVGAWRLGPLTIYPEVALLIGNIYAFIVSPKFKMKMRLKEIQKISDRVWNYVFIPEKQFAFQAGQYMEWTLPGVAFDGRGNRRAFTIASSPTEDTIQLGVKFYDVASTYKFTLSRLQPGDAIYASQLAGDFTLSGNEKTKLAFIAGGIGITPFRSMIKYITDKSINCDISLIYILNKPEELAYEYDFEVAKSLGVRLIPVLTNLEDDTAAMIHSKLSSTLIEKIIPDYSERLFYISGPNTMVKSTKSILRTLRIENQHIKTDYFSGY